MLDPVEAITDFRVHLERYQIPKTLKQLIFGCLSLDPIKRPSFDVAASQLRSNEKVMATFEGGPPLPKDDEASYMVESEGGDNKKKDGKGSRSLLSGFYDSNLVSRLTANSFFAGDKKGAGKSSGGEYVSNYNRDFDFTGKKKKQKKIAIAILVVLLLVLVIGLGVGLKFLLSPSSASSLASGSLSEETNKSVSQTSTSRKNAVASSTTTTSSRPPAETLPLVLPVKPPLYVTSRAQNLIAYDFISTVER